MKDNTDKKRIGNATHETSQMKEPQRKPSHRKTNSSIFFNGNYLSSALDSQGKEQLPPQPSTNQHCKDNPLLLSSNKLLLDLEENNLNYSSDKNNDSVVIKGNEEENNANPIEPAKQKSFISLVNTLSYAKDKKETATDSYLLALGLCNSKKSTYNATSAIEEENTILATESDLTMKKSMKKSTTLESRELPSKNQVDELKISVIARTIHDLIQKKKEKEKDIKLNSETNKKSLLSTFYSIPNEHYDKGSISNKEVIITQPLVIEQAGQLKVLPQKKHNPSLTVLTNKLCLKKNPTCNNASSRALIPFNSKPIARAKKQSKCHIETEYNISSLNRNNFSSAITVINAKTNRINTTLNTNTSISMGTRSNSQLSKSKQRNISWNISPKSPSIPSSGKGQAQDRINYNNKAIALTLRHLTYVKSYEKQDAIDKAEQGSRGSYLILSQPRDTFIGLFKYYEEKNRFIKVYGSEACQNSILPENITSVSIDKGDNTYELSTELLFDHQSPIIFKSRNEFIGLLKS